MSSIDQPFSNFAPAGRDSLVELNRKHEAFCASPLLQDTIDAMSDIVLILNEHRQIVSANRHLLDMLDYTLSQVLGRRPGELVHCVNVDEGSDGCGTAPACQLCGAVEAILQSQQTTHRVLRECRIMMKGPVGAALDFQVTATAVLVGGDRFTICVLKDISDQKRLGVLHRLFFHDLLNTAGGIKGYTQLIREGVPEESPEARELSELAQLAEQLLEEIQAQRDLTCAESGDLEPETQPVKTTPLLQRLQLAYARHPVAQNRTIRLSQVWDGVLITDPRLLGRVIGNMIKNALEAIDPGQSVTLDCLEEQGQVVFCVHNPGVMPPEVQMQVFQRSFSTKSRSGRGVGTHSMKLLGERYLGGRVWFSSCESEGTTFYCALPRTGQREPGTTSP